MPRKKEITYNREDMITVFSMGFMEGYKYNTNLLSHLVKDRKGRYPIKPKGVLDKLMEDLRVALARIGIQGVRDVCKEYFETQMILDKVKIENKKGARK